MIMMTAQVADIKENPWAEISFLVCSSAITSDAIGIIFQFFLSGEPGRHLCSLTGAVEDREAELCTGGHPCPLVITITHLININKDELYKYL